MADQPNDPSASSGESPEISAPARPVLSYRQPELADDMEWVEVFLASDVMHAALIASRLDENGLEARVDGELAAGLGHWGYAGRAGGARVQVLRPEANRARQLIEQFEAERIARRDKRHMKCPACGKPAKSVMHFARKLAAILILGSITLVIATGVLDFAEEYRLLVMALGIIPGLILMFVPVIPRWACVSCGHAWAAPAVDQVDDEDDDDNDSAAIANRAASNNQPPHAQGQ